jgi:hypothetical protein
VELKNKKLCQSGYHSFTCASFQGFVPLLSSGQTLKNNLMKKYIHTIGVALASSLLTLILASVAVCVFIVMPFNKEAVDRGFASWVVTNTATGSTKFAWKDPLVAAKDAYAMEDEMLNQIEEPLPAIQ